VAIRWGGTGRGRGAAGLGSVAAILLAMPGWLASPIAAAADGEGAQAPARSFEVRIERRRVPQAQRVLRATEGERVELRWTADEPLGLHRMATTSRPASRPTSPLSRRSPRT